MELPQLPNVSDELPTTQGLVDQLRTLRSDDDFGTLDLYVGAADAYFVAAIAALETRIAELEVGP
ncbi:hypothetical protein [Gordonia sp. UCD-TK1]|uniref:hypothetical protein n=1 Tax=Gordonia sp. UCD-TK1 TaxID=1857893 RepID=UPI00111216CC|nr:hypothetical protein [Gordonia sp. UCD-TK1]